MYMLIVNIISITSSITKLRWTESDSLTMNIQYIINDALW